MRHDSCLTPTGSDAVAGGDAVHPASISEQAPVILFTCDRASGSPNCPRAPNPATLQVVGLQAREPHVKLKPRFLSKRILFSTRRTCERDGEAQQCFAHVPLDLFLSWIESVCPGQFPHLWSACSLVWLQHSNPSTDTCVYQPWLGRSIFLPCVTVKRAGATCESQDNVQWLKEGTLPQLNYVPWVLNG